MSRSSTATVNQVLTAYAQGHANDLMDAQVVANTLCPRVSVVGASGQYKIFDDNNSFQVYATQRGLGGSARRIEFSATDGSYSCNPHALEVTVDDHERERAGNSPLAASLLDQGKIKSVINASALSYAKRIVDYVVANTTAVSDRGNWSNDGIDPVDQVDEQLEALATSVGSSSGISIVMGLDSWRAFRKHPKVKARCTGVQVQGVSIEQARGLFMLPIQLVVGVLSYDTAKIGQATKVKDQVLAGHVILNYGLPSPTQYDPSAFKCFTTGTGNIESVRTYRDENARSDVHAIDWSEDIRQTSTLAVKRLAIT